ncbi:MAG TPA: S8 family serine peptidase [Gaiellaceae bacterium]
MTRRFMRLSVIAAMAAGALALASTALGQNYVVLYKQQAVPADAAQSIARAGGTLVYSYNQIGVAIARSDSASFRASLLTDNRIENAAGTAGYATQVDGAAADAEGPPPGDLPNSPATDADNLSPLQWDMRQIHTPEAHAITGGSPSVLVGDIDTGLDYTHPDLAANVDSANSVNCVSGAPVPGAVAADDDNGHSTHTAGTIAAASNGIGIVGVAPNVKIAGLKAGNADGFFFPEAVVCSFIWAGTHGFDVTNNSYFADPWLFNCRNDPVQRAIWTAERRAIKFAQQHGVVVVAAEGNQSDDLAHPTQDQTSPDDTTPVTRDITNACAVVPVEVPGVIGVTADGNRSIKSYYSSYGIGTADVVAPGGDRRLQVTAEAPNGRVLSTYPAKFFVVSPLVIKDPTNPNAVYAYLQGTSMASPHVTGVAALIDSWYGHLSPGRVAAIIGQTADPIACPDPVTLALYAPFPALDGGAPQTCQGGLGNNGWYGSGQVNALSAITHSP